MPRQHVGNATVDKVFEIDGLTLPFSVTFPSVTDADLRAASPWLDDPQVSAAAADSRTNLSWHTYVIRFGGYTVLIDTGLGNDKARPDFIPEGAIDTDFPARLQDSGVNPEEVTHVLCTHLHFDHVGWNTYLSAGKWQATFPNARYLFPCADYEELLETHGQDPAHGTAFRESILPIADKGLVGLFEDGEVILDVSGVQLRVEGAPGHSHGNSIFHLTSGDEHAIFCGDVIHHPIQLVREDIALPFDDDPARAVAARRKLLRSVADTDITLYPAHFGGTSGGHVISDPRTGGYQWMPLPASNRS